jgi:hypothetical protein
MKKNNPNIPILIREATGIEPKVWARYSMKEAIHQSAQKLTVGRLWQGVLEVFVRCANPGTASTGSSTDGPPVGFSDKEIEDNVSKLVMSEPTPVDTPASHDR